MINKKKHVAFLMGGLSTEREVSINSGNACYDAIDKKKYDASKIIIDKDFYNQILSIKPDICFNALHGSFGEDGTIQSILNKIKIPYTHSGANASSIAMNKLLTKNYLSHFSQNTNEHIIFPKTYNFKSLDEFKKFLPLVLKPISGGSSVEIDIINNEDELKNLKDKIFSSFFIVEPLVGNRELTVSVLNNKSLVVTEIVSKKNFFYDYNSKYSTNGSLHILPAKIPKNIYDKVTKWAQIAHELLGCSGISRSDFRYDDIKDKLYMLEINTQPGMTKTSLSPEQANYCGITLTELVDQLILKAKFEKV
tara:strand:+ start:390 stop:1313 length:924 start_codon:yes stop_codon:yes gene_type:complete